MMNAKKKFLFITSIVLLVVMTCCIFASCKSPEEKEAAYYDKTAAAVGKTVGTLNTLTDVLFNNASWTAEFMYAITYYRTDSKKVYADESIESEEYSYGDASGSSIARGSKDVAGWPEKNVEVLNEDKQVVATIQNSTNQFVHFMYFQVDYTDINNYKVTTTTFEDTDRSNYYKYKDNVKKYDTKFKKTGTLEYKVENGVESGDLAEEVNPLDIIKANTDKEAITTYGISASDNFRIYTRFMRIESRHVYEYADGVAGAIIDRAANDASNKAYWTGYGDDISYNWDNIYGMSNERLTVLYSKGKSKINQLEIYNEDILAYYTKNNNFDTSRVLKADVVSYTEMVVKFSYK